MKFLITPDSLKGSISAADAALCMEKACKRVFPGCETLLLPGGDGGEGTLDALKAAWGESAYFESMPVKGLQGNDILAPILLCGQKAAVESARAAGLPLPHEEKHILTADSFGVGQMILHAMGKGAQEIFVTLGGTGSDDGGLHMLIALGMKAFDAEGNPVPRGIEGLEKLQTVDLSSLDKRLQTVKLTVLSDVNNPLLGEKGATYVYAPQKGASKEMLPRLESAMTRYADIMERALGQDIRRLPGAGAAGGMGAALLGVLGAQRKSGADAVLDEMHYEKHLADTDLVFTAEGRMDAQSVQFGKFPARAADRACKMNVPVIALVGGRTRDADAFHTLGNTALFSICDGPITLENAVKHSEVLMEQAAYNALLVYRMGLNTHRG
ncbi:MAG: glycerate kinase [Clostridia bacterium]|nr:glycerate kinase [Clostridia bacterium]